MALGLSTTVPAALTAFDWLTVMFSEPSVKFRICGSSWTHRTRRSALCWRPRIHKRPD